VLLIAAIGTAVYCVAMFAPAYLDNIDVTDAVVSAYNQSGTRPNEQILQDLKDKLKRIGTHRELNADGDLEEVMGLGAADEDVSFEQLPDNSVVVEVRYVREVRLKPTGRWTKLRFSTKKAGTPAGLK
jgi:hypothetical protein